MSKFLTVPCVTCGAKPGAWCTYVKPIKNRAAGERYRTINGQNMYHNPRIEAARNGNR